MAKITNAGPSNATLAEPLETTTAEGEPVLVETVESVAAQDPAPAPEVEEPIEIEEPEEVDPPQRQDDPDPEVTEPASTDPASGVEPTTEDQAEGAAEASPDPGPDEVVAGDSAGTEGPVRPADSAAKAEWVAYAMALDPDLTESVAGARTKAQLIEVYG